MRGALEPAEPGMRSFEDSIEVLTAEESDEVRAHLKKIARGSLHSVAKVDPGERAFAKHDPVTQKRPGRLLLPWSSAHGWRC